MSKTKSYKMNHSGGNQSVAKPGKPVKKPTPNKTTSFGCCNETKPYNMKNGIMYNGSGNG